MMNINRKNQRYLQDQRALKNLMQIVQIKQIFMLINSNKKAPSNGALVYSLESKFLKFVFSSMILLNSETGTLSCCIVSLSLMVTV